jgi:hypothetical protein
MDFWQVVGFVIFVAGCWQVAKWLIKGLGWLVDYFIPPPEV